MDAAARLAGLKQLHPLIVGGGEQPTAPRLEPAAPLPQLVRPGVLMDCLGEPGSGAGLIALWLCRLACKSQGELVVVDPSREFYPPAAVAWGVDPSRLLVVLPDTANDALAAVEQSLRSPAVGAVWAVLDRIAQQPFRRLLLAVEEGHAFATLVRPARRLADSCCADYQFHFVPVPQEDGCSDVIRIRAEQTRSRHGPLEQPRNLTIDWRAGHIS
ncbi:hypothetical protein Pla123a_43430 [Posidoniimonas polymericola]|uniref:Uncharacterized protein n=2 Tax=Posidoniimonas polymericola TaxID=2528002 RepID=A0A5C5XYB6_9BACT|nr:hypothetical protein Pla123a_43430 [Posidoniimonas polymericola]